MLLALQGSSIEKEHCLLEVSNSGSRVCMRPISAKCYLNGHRVEGERVLTQGDVIQFGDCLKFRFNNPKEASYLLEKRRSGNFSLEVFLHF